jgi:hypothetical protein
MTRKVSLVRAGHRELEQPLAKTIASKRSDNPGLKRRNETDEKDIAALSGKTESEASGKPQQLRHDQ